MRYNFFHVLKVIFRKPPPLFFWNLWPRKLYRAYFYRSWMSCCADCCLPNAHQEMTIELTWLNKRIRKSLKLDCVFRCSLYLLHKTLTPVSQKQCAPSSTGPSSVYKSASDHSNVSKSKVNVVLASKTSHCGPQLPPNVKYIIDTGLKREVGWFWKENATCGHTSISKLLIKLLIKSSYINFEITYQNVAKGKRYMWSYINFEITYLSDLLCLGTSSVFMTSCYSLCVIMQHVTM